MILDILWIISKFTGLIVLLCCLIWLFALIKGKDKLEKMAFIVTVGGLIVTLGIFLIYAIIYIICELI